MSTSDLENTSSASEQRHVGSKSSLYPSNEENNSPIIFSLLFGTIKIIFSLVFGLVFLLLFILLTITGIGPLIEFNQSKRDEKEVLNQDVILQEHPEMFLLNVPGDINKASCGASYRIMVRLTKPTKGASTNTDQLQLPPVILPGGLASNLMTMSRHQDELTKKHGFTVVNFDRLGVGFSDPYPPELNLKPASAADVAREMNFVMEYCENHIFHTNNKRWICVGSSMGANVATAFMTLYPNRIGGFFNLDGLPHAFLKIQCKKFLRDGKKIMDMMRRVRWTGLPRFMFRLALQGSIPTVGDAFTVRQLVGVMCRDQFFVTTGLEYTTLMSCCDLECAAWGRQATFQCDSESLRLLASLAPNQSIIVNESKGIMPRSVTNERSKSELGTKYVAREDKEFITFEESFRSLAMKNPDDVDNRKTHCNWPSTPKHPVGNLVGGVEEDTTIHPLAPQFEKLVVRIMCARDYTGLERDYTQEARNHAAARCTLQVLMSGDGEVYYYPRLSHLNLWQQVDEVVSITHDISRAILVQDI